MSEEKQPNQNALVRWWSDLPRMQKLLIEALLGVSALRLLFGFEIAVLGALVFIAAYVYRISSQLGDK